MSKGSGSIDSDLTALILRDARRGRILKFHPNLPKRLAIGIFLCLLLSPSLAVFTYQFFASGPHPGVSQTLKRLSPSAPSQPVHTNEDESLISLSAQLRILESEKNQLIEEKQRNWQQSASEAIGMPYLFSSSVHSATEGNKKIQIEGMSTGKTKSQEVTVKFSIRYIDKDSGNQQGRFLVLLFTEEGGLLTYPKSAFTGGIQPNWLSPEQGEYYSVSRFRQATIKFASSTSRWTGLVLIFDKDQKLILQRQFGSGGSR